MSIGKSSEADSLRRMLNEEGIHIEEVLLSNRFSKESSKMLKMGVWA